MSNGAPATPGPAGPLTGAVISSALVTVFVWVAKQFWHTEIPGEVAAALTTLVTAAGAGIGWVIGKLL